jgi:type III secretory pathway component EscT
MVEIHEVVVLTILISMPLIILLLLFDGSLQLINLLNNQVYMGVALGVVC